MIEPPSLAHDLVRPLVEGLVDKIRAAARRVVLAEHDAEAIHDVRVSMRRLRTVLRSARCLYGRDDLGPVEWALRELSQATSALRDEEVLVETLAATQLSMAARRAVDRWLVRRARYARGLRRKAVALLGGPDLEAVLDVLLARLERGPTCCLSLGVFAFRRLERARRGVWELLPIDDDDPPTLHRLRIGFKRLRYTAEMLAGFMTPLDAAAAAGGGADLGAPLRERYPDYAAVARLAARMQKDLGMVHDVDVALVTVRRVRGLRPVQRRVVVTALARLRRRLVEQASDWLDQLPVGLLGPGSRPAG